MTTKEIIPDETDQDNQNEPNEERVPTHPHVTVRINGEDSSLEPCELTAEQDLAQHRSDLQDAGGTIRFTIHELLLWPDDARYGLFTLIVDTSSYEVVIHGNAQVFENLFMACLVALEHSPNVERSVRGKRAALEAATLVHPNGLEFACQQLHERLSNLGVRAITCQSLIKEARNLLGQRSSQSEVTPLRAAREFLASLCIVNPRRLGFPPPNADEGSGAEQIASDSIVEDAPRELDSIRASQTELTDGDHGDYPTVAEEALGAHVISPNPEDGSLAPLLFYRDSFWKWTGQCWAVVPTNELKILVIQFLQRSDLYSHVGDRFIRDVVSQLQGLIFLDCSDRDMPLWIHSSLPTEVSDSPYLAFANGVVETAEMLEADPTNGQQVGVQPLNRQHFTTVVCPFPFDPNAECPLWRETISEIFPPRNPTDRRVEILQEFMGDSLIGGRPIHQKFMVMVGDGANGKSTIMQLWRYLLGPANVSNISIEHLNHDFRLAQLAGKLANMSFDLNYVNTVCEGVLKALTTGDPIQANPKNKDPFTMVPTARQIFATNQLPQMNDRSRGIWRRLIAVPFFENFTQRDDIHRVERLREELPGIFVWALEGARRLHRQGHFTECNVCRECAEDHRLHSDPFLQFMEECLVVDSRHSEECSKVYKAYKDYCEANGRKPTNSSILGKRLLGIENVTKTRPRSRKNVTRPYFYQGLKIESHPKWISRH